MVAGAEALGGGSPEVRPFADQAPVSLGFEGVDDSAIAGMARIGLGALRRLAKERQRHAGHLRGVMSTEIEADRRAVQAAEGKTDVLAETFDLMGLPTPDGIEHGWGEVAQLLRASATAEVSEG